MGKPEEKAAGYELTQSIIGAAQAVHRALKPGLDEKLYENALCIELAEQKLHFSQQMQFPVYYRDRFIGKLIPDLIVEDEVIVDAKVVESFSQAHVSQMLGYLNITGLKVGLLLNFKGGSLAIKRVSRFEDNLCKSEKSVVQLQSHPQPEA